MKRYWCWILLFCLCATLSASEMLAKKWTQATAKELGGAERYLTYITTDKPIYRSGEQLYVRGVMLHAHTRKPLEDNMRPMAHIRIRGPKGDIVARGHAEVAASSFGFSWPVPHGQPGGEYTVLVTYPWNGHTPAERKFDIRAYRAPRLKSQITFLRDGYGPGDEVAATLHTERAEGGLPAGARVTATALLDGVSVFDGTTQVDSAGNATVRFKLPAKIERGEGTLSFAIEDGGVVETAAKTMPILLQTVDLELYPEGGDLVAGLSCRVYLEARTPAQKPADLAGVIVNAQGKEVATFRTEHEGRGRFVFTPNSGQTYTLKILEPAGITTTYPLPAAKQEGTILTAVEEQTARGEAIRLQVGSTKEERLRVTLSQREKELASVRVPVKAKTMQDIMLTPPASAAGILIATVWNEEGLPLAERLIYRQPEHTVNIQIEPDKTKYMPGGQVRLTIKTTDENGKPISANVALSVTDDSVLEMIEKREQAPRLPVMVLLENDVQELADAHVYLDPKNPKAPLAVDLLLGTQGWRCFAFLRVSEFMQTYGDNAKRVLAFQTPHVAHYRTKAATGRAGVPQAATVDGVFRLDEIRKKEGVYVKRNNDIPEDIGDVLDVEEKPADANEPVETVLPAPKREQLELGKKRDLRPRVMGREKRAIVKDMPMEEILAEDVFDYYGQNDLVAVRFYAHKVRAGRKAGTRSDFTETLYWNAGIRTSAEKGEAVVTFGLSDSVTAFRVSVDAFDTRGALGETSQLVESVEPFYIEPKMPLEVTYEDKIDLPVALINSTDKELSGKLEYIATFGEERELGTQTFSIPANTRIRTILTLVAKQYNGAGELYLKATAGNFSDQVTRPLIVKPKGFPMEITDGGVLSSQAAYTAELEIPQQLVNGSLSSRIIVYPTPLARLTSALQRLIREPYGCFEQTSSTTYPLTMAQQYFTTHAGVDPALIEKSKNLLEKGYRKLVGFECKKKGYEWFGADPGHEALTAYGLLQFMDMSKIREVDQEMIHRTRKWLMDRRDGKGSFARKDQSCDSFGRAPQGTTDAYITWALIESGEKDLAKEIEHVLTQGDKTNDSYLIALSANIAHKTGNAKKAKSLMEKLRAKQDQNGSIGGAKTSITQSGGQALTIETTSLAVLAWLKDPAFAGDVENAIRYIAKSCEDGRFGSTQSTVLALRAIVTYDQLRAHPRANGTLRLLVDHATVGDVPFSKASEGEIELPDISALLTPGKHVVELRMQNGSPMPFSLAITFNALRPDSNPACKVTLHTSLAKTDLTEGEITEAVATITNRSDETIATPIAIVGLPGGLEPRHDQLKELVKAGTIASYEVIGREVILYWRGMNPKQSIRVPLSLIAAIPGSYEGPASRCYLYYVDEFKDWNDGLKVKITPRQQK